MALRKRTSRIKAKKFEPKVFDHNNSNYITFSGIDTVRAKLFDRAGNLIKNLGKYKFAAFSPDNNYIATLSNDKKASLLTSHGRIIKRFDDKERVYDISFSDDSQQLFLTKKRRLGNTFYIEKSSLSGELLSDMQHQSTLISAHFSKNNEYILTSNKGHIVTLWKVENGKTSKIKDIEHHPIKDLNEEDKRWFNTTHSKFSPNNECFFTWQNQTNFKGTSSSFERKRYPSEIKIWNIQGELIGEIPQEKQIISVDISPDGELIAVCATGKNVSLYNSKGEYQFSIGQIITYNTTMFIPEEGKIIVGGLNSTEIYNTKGVALAQKLTLCPFDYPKKSKDNQSYIIYSNVTGLARLMSMDLEVIHEFREITKITSLNLSPTEAHILLSTMGRERGQAKIFDYDGKELLVIQESERIATAIYSPDGQSILITRMDGIANLYDIEGNRIAQLDKHQGNIYASSFSNDGKYILTASEDGTAKLWPTPQTIHDWLETNPLKPIDEGKLSEYGII
jgi:WD40 repeat protein